MSAHADSREILRWLGGFKAPPKRTFLVHGEPDAMQALRQTIAGELRWEVHMPEWTEGVELRN
jgi:metallo-beta-lactamase family protein